MSPMHGAAATFKDHFSSQAGEYARYRPQYPDDLFDWLAVASPALGEAFDLGTGSGQSAWGLAQHFACVPASDPSAARDSSVSVAGSGTAWVAARAPAS